MNANKLKFLTLVAVVGVFSGNAAFAVPLDSRSTTKVNNAKASAWRYSGAGESNPEANKPAALQKQVVNIGSKKNNTCNLNVGSQTNQRKPGEAKYGQKAPKEVIVTSKDIINICK